MASISAFEPLIHKGLYIKKKKNCNTKLYCTKLFSYPRSNGMECNRCSEAMLDLPIVDIAKEECTKINVEQLASTRATSAMQIALAVSDSPGHPYPFIVPPAKPRVPRLGMA
jgi:hypothetical protein